MAELKTKPTADIMSKPMEQIPVEVHLRGVRTSERAEARPIMFPLLLAGFPINLSATRIRSELRDRPEVLGAYSQLAGCLGLTALIVEYLRSIAPGYPHADLVFGVDGTPWTQLSNYSEVPQNVGGPVLPEGATKAADIGLDRFAPSVSVELADQLIDLTGAVSSSAPYLDLKSAYKKVNADQNLQTEIRRARDQFEKELRRVNELKLPRDHWGQEVERISRKVYEKRGLRIQSYVSSFLEYEWLIERIYWLLSQLVIYEVISSLSTAEPNQLQQASINNERPRLVTGLTLTSARSVNIGQLIHLTLCETNGRADGIYQVDQWYSRYDIGVGGRDMLRARSLWECELKELEEIVGACDPPILAPADRRQDRPVFRIEITGHDGKVTSLEAGDPVLNMEIRKSMYLP